MKYCFLLFVQIALLISCNQGETKSSSETVVTIHKDVLADNIDKSIKPGDDFFLFANGGWINKTPIPGSESGWGIGNMVQEEIYQRLRKINEEAATGKHAPGTVSQKIADFWKSGMDSVATNRAGLTSLQKELDAINGITNTEQLVLVASALKRKGIDAIFSDYVSQDDKNSEVMAFKIDQGGLGLPSREYYFNTDERSIKVKTAYKEYVLKTMLQLDTNKTQAQKKTDNIFTLETKLASSSRKLADLRDPYKNYNKKSKADLATSSPAFNWNTYFTVTGVDKVDTIIIGQPEFIAALNREMVATPLNTWKDYLKMRLVQSTANYLDTATFMNYFTYRQSLTGASEPRARWKRVVDSEEAAIGEALGQLFVKEYFNETAKKRYINIVENIREAYVQRINNLTWMSDSTKQKAKEKLGQIKQKVGYPDRWKDFSSLQIDNGPWVQNVLRANEWWHNYNVNKLGKPVDRTEWGMTPQTYNAYYNPSNNEIVMPAGIFAVPGYRDEQLDDAMVYGYAAASTIGHEITHGFDDQGRQYDAAGNLKNWWNKSDEAEFGKRAKMIIHQFNEYNPVDTLHINGEATQGENIADLGGMLLGLDAFKKTEAYKSNKKIAGYTPLQRYFLGYALGWQYQTRPDRLANMVMTDVHAPAKERVNGPIVNVPEFYEAFNVKPGDKMYRADSLRVKIW